MNCGLLKLGSCPASLVIKLTLFSWGGNLGGFEWDFFILCVTYQERGVIHLWNLHGFKKDKLVVKYLSDKTEKIHFASF